MNNLIPYSTWCGTEESLQQYMRALDSYSTFMKDRKEDDDDKLPDYMKPYNPLSKVGKVGVVKIAGSLIPGEVSKLINDWFGVTGYDNIKQAVVEALADKSIQSIYLQVESGGGAVMGLKNAADFLKQAGEVKPIYAHTDGMMASAAYWLGSTAQHVSSSDMSKVGSIGTIAVQTEITDMRKEMGVTDTVIRSGRYKALGHPLEKLSDEGREIIQAELDYMTTKFVEAVAENRGRSADVVDTIMGQGRVFMGEQALAVGLVDAIETAAEALARASASSKRAKVGATVTQSGAKAETSADNGVSQPTEDQNMLTEAQKQALAAGASLETVLAASAEDAPAADSQESASPAPSAETPAEQPDYKAQLESAQAEIATLKSTGAATQSALDAASAEIEVQKTAADALATIVSGITNQMNVAMGRSKVDYAATDAAAAYATVMAEFKSKFPVGGVAADTRKSEPEAAKASLPVSPREWEAAKNLFKN
jgi:signal peptide peptidase SppA